MLSVHPGSKSESEQPPWSGDGGHPRPRPRNRVVTLLTIIWALVPSQDNLPADHPITGKPRTADNPHNGALQIHTD